MGLDGTIFTIAASPDLMNFWSVVSNWWGSAAGVRTYGSSFDGFTSTAINLLQDLGELASNVGSVAIEDWGVTSTDLTRVVEDDDLGVEGLGGLGGVLLGVTGNVTTTDFLDGNVLDVEANVVSGETLDKLLVVHLDGLDFSGDTGGGEGHDHTSLDTRGMSARGMDEEVSGTYTPVSTRPTGTVPIPPIL
jgi:hypothetical protein